jgi:hypothetical protein
MAGAMPAMTPDPPLLFFPGLRAPPRTGERILGRRGPPPIPPALSRPGKNHPAVGPAAKGNNGAMRWIEPGKAPVWEWKMPRPEGLAHFLRAAHRRISKKCAKGFCGITIPKRG